MKKTITCLILFGLLISMLPIKNVSASENSRLNQSATASSIEDLSKATDNEHWTTIYSTTTGDGGIDKISFEATDARYVRMNGIERATNYGYSLWELEVHSADEPEDNSPPTAPSNLTSSSVSDTTVSLQWTESTDNVGVSSYDIYKGSDLIGSSASTSFIVTGLTANTAYSFYVKARDVAGNVSDASNVIDVTTSAADTSIVSGETYKLTAQHSGKNLEAGDFTADGAKVQQWTNSGSARQKWKVIDVGNGYYKLIVQSSGKTLTVAGGSLEDGADVQQWTDNDSSNQKWKIIDVGGGYYKLLVQSSGKALDVIGGYTNDGANVQQWTDNGNDQQKWKFTLVDSSPDTTAPTAPANLESYSKTNTSVSLVWTASTDDVDVISYDVYNGTTLVGSTTTTSYTVTGLTANTTYSFTVKARDAAGNISAASNIVKITTNSTSENRGFYINGTTLYDAKGNPFVMRGINHAYTWYKGQESVAIPAIAKTGANTIRIVLSDGQQWTKDDLSVIQNLITLSEQNKLVVVLEVHDGTGSDSATILNNISNYWIEMKSALIGKESTVILNIANEWYGTWDGGGWAQGYKSVIPKLRNAGIKNTIMVDSAGWGQYPQSIFDYGTEVFNADPLKNTMFSIHMYEYAGGNAATVKSNMDNVLNKNLALVIGEFGIKHTSGDVDEATIMSYAEQKGVGYLAWSWKGNSPGLDYLDMATDWQGSSFTEQGRIIIEGPNGIRATSRLSTVFNGSYKKQSSSNP